MTTENLVWGYPEILNKSVDAYPVVIGPRGKTGSQEAKYPLVAGTTDFKAGLDPSDYPGAVLSGLSDPRIASRARRYRASKRGQLHLSV